MWINYNPNPVARMVDDCAVRAISKALDVDWEQAHILLDINSINMGDMPHANSVWGSVLRQNGFYRKAIPDTCPDCYTAAEFCKDNPTGVYVLSCNGHVMTVVDGDIYDAWDSSLCIPQYYWYRKV